MIILMDKESLDRWLLELAIGTDRTEEGLVSDIRAILGLLRFNITKYGDPTGSLDLFRARVQTLLLIYEDPELAKFGLFF